LKASARSLASGLLLASLAWGMGCTIRHSQTLVGSLERISTPAVKHRDTGIEVGFGSAGQGLTLSEPTSPHELLLAPCEVALAQTDARAMVFYFYYFTAGFPQSEVVSYCVP
jgi:hypothetical protein